MDGIISAKESGGQRHSSFLLDFLGFRKLFDALILTSLESSSRV